MATIRGVFIYRLVVSEVGPPPPPPPLEQDSRITDLPLNIGADVLDVWYDGCYILVCTTSGVECLNSRTFESIWYFDSIIVQSTCSNQEIVCFGTTCSGVYYNDFPTASGILNSGFLAGCKKVSSLTSSGIADICTTSGGFFVGGESGVDILTTSSSGLNLEVTCQLTCSGVNSVAYSHDTETYYWSTASKAYCAAVGIKQLVIKSTATPGYVINSINIEYIDNGDILYINTVNGIVRAFSLTCSGVIDDRNIISSDYESRSCGAEKIAAGYDTSLIEINVASGTEDIFEVVYDISKVLYYTW